MLFTDISIPDEEEQADDAAHPPAQGSYMELEVSIEEIRPLHPAMEVVPQDSGEVTFQVVKGGTKRGGDMLVDSRGYTYNICRKRTRKMYWWCTIRRKDHRCPVTVQQGDETFSLGVHDHDHPGEVGVADRLKAQVKVKRLVQEDILTSAMKVVENVLIEDKPQNAPKPDNLARAANRFRQRLRPAEPQDCDFQLAADFLPADFLVADIRMDDARHIVMATAEQLNYLCQIKNWYADGTFKVVRLPFKQLWSIHGFVVHDGQAIQVPLVFALMSRTRKRDYVRVLEAIVNSCPTPPVVESCMLDYEQAAWSGFKTVFLAMRLQGCLFHWTQCVWRKIGELGLAGTYFDKDCPELRKYMARTMALAFLPPAQMEDAVQWLEERSPAQLAPLHLYIIDQWLSKEGFPPSAWSVFMKAVRTNNDLEGWHNRFNGRSARCNIQFYILVPLLHQEAQRFPIVVGLMTDDKISRRARSKYRKKQQKAGLHI